MKIVDYPVRHSYEVAGGSRPKFMMLEIITAALIFILPAIVLFILSP